MTPAQAARRLGLSADRVRQMVAEGKLPAVVTPLGRLLPASAVDALAAERAAKTAKRQAPA